MREEGEGGPAPPRLRRVIWGSRGEQERRGEMIITHMPVKMAVVVGVAIAAVLGAIYLLVR